MVPLSQSDTTQNDTSAETPSQKTDAAQTVHTTFTYNSAANKVRAISSTATTAITSSDFTGNRVNANLNGSKGGAIWAQGAMTSVSGCYFSGNRVTGGDGGAICINVANTSTGLKLTNSYFADNSASASGGAVAVLGSAHPADMYVSGCTFDGNGAQTAGRS